MSRERELMNEYLKGVESRRKLSFREREEIRYAWLAGLIAAEQIKGESQSDAAGEQE